MYGIISQEHDARQMILRSEPIWNFGNLRRDLWEIIVQDWTYFWEPLFIFTLYHHYYQHTTLNYNLCIYVHFTITAPHIPPWVYLLAYTLPSPLPTSLPPWIIYLYTLYHHHYRHTILNYLQYLFINLTFYLSTFIYLLMYVKHISLLKCGWGLCPRWKLAFLII